MKSHSVKFVDSSKLIEKNLKGFRENINLGRNNKMRLKFEEGRIITQEEK